MHVQPLSSRLPSCSCSCWAWHLPLPSRRRHRLSRYLAMSLSWQRIRTNCWRDSASTRTRVKKCSLPGIHPSTVFTVDTFILIIFIIVVIYALGRFTLAWPNSAWRPTAHPVAAWRLGTQFQSLSTTTKHAIVFCIIYYKSIYIYIYKCISSIFSYYLRMQRYNNAMYLLVL